MQQRLLEFTRRQKAEEVRRLFGEGPSSEEIEGAARLTRFGREIQKQISGLDGHCDQPIAARWL